jgi:hypothetical protein
MLKHIQIVNEKTKLVNVNIDDSMTAEKAVENGFSAELYEVEKSYDGCDWYLKGYAPQEPLEHAKSEKIAELKSERDRNEQDYFVYDGHKYDSDSISCQRITDTVLLANAIGDSFEIDWTDYDNEDVTLDKDDMNGLLAALASHSQACHAQYRTKKDAVNNAQTVEEVKSIVWEEITV